MGRTVHNLNIKVAHSLETDEYAASWGKHCGQTAHSAADALRMLAEEFDAKFLHGSAEAQLQKYRHETDALCRECEAPIFFAVIASGKYFPLDVLPIHSSALGRSDRAAILAKVKETAKGPRPLAVFVNANLPKQPVYLPHWTTCGANLERPTTPTIARRWDQNHTVSQERVDEVVSRLHAIRAARSTP